MKKKVGIHQANYIPWPGYFNKIKNSDIFVFLDHVDYVKNDFMNRNKIKTSNGWYYLTIPIERVFYRSPFNTILLPKDNTWAEKHWSSIEANYKKSPYFEAYKDFFFRSYSLLPKTLEEFNINIIIYILQQLDIDTEIVKSSELKFDTSLTKTDLLIEIARKVGASTYISGEGGSNYLDLQKFKDIKVEFQKFTLSRYNQQFGEFVPNLSIIDLLFNEGENSKNFI